jgi:hypothetical protein
MAYPDVEDVLEAVRQTFIAQFPDALAAVDARKSTPLNPYPPEGYHFGERQNEPMMPTMLFLAENTNTEQDEYGWRRQAYSLAIEAYYTDQDIENLERIIQRYAAAIDDVLRNNQQLGIPDYVRSIMRVRQLYTAIRNTQANLMQGVRVEFDVILNTD